MRILLDNDGYVSQWMERDDTGSMSENDIVIAAPENFDFSTFREEYRYYKLVDGVLVKDENRVIPERENTRPETEKRETADDVLNALLGVSV